MTDSLKIFCAYVLFLICMICFAQTSTAQVHILSINADWNEKNSVVWIDSLENCSIDYVRLSKECIPCQQTNKQKGIESVPTIIIYKNGIEIKRYTADISFTIKETREEVQRFIDEAALHTLIER
jgi:hypothetical protein